MQLVIIGAILALTAIWCVSTRRRLIIMNENINSAMSQIGVQLSSQFDALTALLDLTNDYDTDKSQALIETVKARRGAVTADSAPDDVLRQEGVILEALGRISRIAEEHPELKTNEGYLKCMNAVDSYEKMVRTARLIYNDSVTKLNRELSIFPESLIAVAFGFRKRDYLEAADERTVMPAVN